MNALTIIANLHRASQIAEELYSEAVHHLDVTPRQVQVLTFIAHNVGASQTNVVESTGIDRSTLADICRRLVRKGLATRKRTRADARMYALRLTPEGERILRLAEKIALDTGAKIKISVPGVEHLRFAKPARIAAE